MSLVLSLLFVLLARSTLAQSDAAAAAQNSNRTKVILAVLFSVVGLVVIYILFRYARARLSREPKKSPKRPSPVATVNLLPDDPYIFTPPPEAFFEKLNKRYSTISLNRDRLSANVASLSDGKRFSAFTPSISDSTLTPGPTPPGSPMTPAPILTITPLSCSPQSNSSDLAGLTVIHPHVPAESDEIALFPGQSVCIEVDFEDGWARGQNLATGLNGVFPIGCVMTSVDLSVQVVSRTHSVNSRSVALLSPATVVIDVPPECEVGSK